MSCELIFSVHLWAGINPVVCLGILCSVCSTLWMHFVCFLNIYLNLFSHCLTLGLRCCTSFQQSIMVSFVFHFCNNFGADFPRATKPGKEYYSIGNQLVRPPASNLSKVKYSCSLVWLLELYTKTLQIPKPRADRGKLSDFRLWHLARTRSFSIRVV